MPAMTKPHNRKQETPHRNYRAFREPLYFGAYYMFFFFRLKKPEWCVWEMFDGKKMFVKYIYLRNISQTDDWSAIDHTTVNTNSRNIKYLNNHLESPAKIDMWKTHHTHNSNFSVQLNGDVCRYQHGKCCCFFAVLNVVSGRAEERLSSCHQH